MGEWIMPSELHDRIVAAAYKKRGYTGKEAAQAAAFSNLTARHGIKTHNAIKALHLDELFGSKVGGCVPGAKIEKLPSDYRAVQKWNANKKLGQATAVEAMEKGANGFLNKPFSDRQLNDALEELLGSA